MNDWQQLYDLESNRFRRVIVKFSIETLSKAFYSCPDEVFEKMLNALKVMAKEENKRHIYFKITCK